MEQSNPRLTYQRFDDLVINGEKLFSTRSGTVFRAKDRFSAEEVTTQLLRCPLSIDSDGADIFLRRLEIMQRLPLACLYLRKFGVDDSHKAYLIADAVQGKSLIHFSQSTDLQRLFVEVLQVLATLHQNEVILGDVCEDSFYVEPSGRVLLVGLLGPFEIETMATTALPPAETMRFLSPEQRSGAVPIRASDVYSIGALGYRLFTGRFMQGDKVSLIGANEETLLAPAPSTVRPELPKWLDDILGKCLEPRPEDRFIDAEDLLHSFQQAVRTGSASSRTSRFSSPTTVVSPSTVVAIRERAKSPSRLTTQLTQVSPSGAEALPVPKRPPLVAPRRSLKWLAAPAAAGSVVIALIYLLSSFSGFGPGIDLPGIPSGLEGSFAILADKEADVYKRQENLNTVVSSTDPQAISALALVLSRIEPGEFRDLVLRQLEASLRKQNLARAGAVLAKWETVSKQSKRDLFASPAYPWLAAALDGSKASAERVDSIKQAFTSEPLLALQITAALALDEVGGSAVFVETLRQLLGALTGRDFAQRSLESLLLSNARLATFFEEDLRVRVERLTPRELSSGLSQLAETDSDLLKALATETLNRRIVPPFQAIFLEVLTVQNVAELSRGLKGALVRGAKGELQLGDVALVGHWSEPQAERVLLAMCAIAAQPEVALAAFDTLASRSLDSAPARGLLEWVKSYFWDFRKKLIKAIGILGLVEISSSEQVEYALEVLSPFASEGSLLRILLEANQESLTTLALSRFGPSTPSPELIALLSHQSKVVRIGAVRALKGRNDLSVLQSVFKAFEQEKDEEVREVYRELHWVTRERELKAN